MLSKAAHVYPVTDCFSLSPLNMKSQSYGDTYCAELTKNGLGFDICLMKQVQPQVFVSLSQYQLGHAFHGSCTAGIFTEFQLRKGCE